MKRVVLASTILFLSPAYSQSSPPLSSPASIYRNVENLATKNIYSAATKVTEIPRKSASENQQKLATLHLSRDENVALVLIDKGSVVFEGISKGANRDSRFVSFSMAKSIMSIMVGHALCERKITSLEDTADMYASELKGTTAGKATIKSLLAMSSGNQVPGNLNGQPYGDATYRLLTQSVSMRSLIKNYDNDNNKSIFGTTWNYNNLDTDSLYFVVKGATGNKFSDFFKNVFVENVGLKDPTIWAVDNEGNQITHSFYFASLGDWTRIALYIRDQIKNNHDSCMGKYLKESTTRKAWANSPDFHGYGYQFFINNKVTGSKDFWMVGFGGQRIGFDLDKDKIIINFSWKSNADNVYRLIQQF
jgi:CubicO group peptidase (beta-lactamase class C family)